MDLHDIDYKNVSNFSYGKIIDSEREKNEGKLWGIFLENEYEHCLIMVKIHEFYNMHLSKNNCYSCN